MWDSGGKFLGGKLFATEVFLMREHHLQLAHFITLSFQPTVQLHHLLKDK